jgi:RND superfamily putative drug exporter
VVAGPAAPLIPVAWIAAAVLAYMYLPALATGEGSLADFTPRDTPAIATEERSAGAFGHSISRVAVVQRDPAGLSPAAQRQTVAAAVDLTRNPRDPLLGALPLLDDPRVWPKDGDTATTAVTYLYFAPATPWADQVRLAEAYAQARLTQPRASVVGVTGSVPARVAQEDAIAARLSAVEIATVILVALVLGVTFRSVLAPVITLLAAGVAYVIGSRLVALAGRELGLVPPSEIDPLVVVLLLGIVADYAIFYLSAAKERLGFGERRGPAARDTTAQLTPIIVIAGLMVAAGTAALLAATQATFRSFGPSLAISVLAGLVVSVTFVPAVMATLGRVMFWPRGLAARPPRQEARPGWFARQRARIAHLATHRGAALGTVVVCVAVLIVAASGLRWIGLGLDFISGLPASSEPKQAAAAASEGFARGILSPTEVLLQKAGVGTQTTQLADLELAIGSQPGVAAVLGPREQPPDPRTPFAISADNNAARYYVVFSTDPLGSSGIDTLESLQAAMPNLIRQSGLAGVRVGYAGDTAIAAFTVDRTIGDLGRVGVAVIVIDVILLALFLRGLAAPLYLVAASVLALAAALGATAYFFRLLPGPEGLTYYVPFAASVLLVSLGSDYTVFVVGRIWEERRVRPLRGAIETAVPKARSAVSVAAVTLALSFAMLAIVNLWSFRQLAFLLAAGVLIDAFFVRSLLVPALVALFGRTWTGAAAERRERPGKRAVAAPTGSPPTGRTRRRAA